MCSSCFQVLFILTFSSDPQSLWACEEQERPQLVLHLLKCKANANVFRAEDCGAASEPPTSQRFVKIKQNLAA